MVTDTKMRAAKRKNIAPPAKASKAKKVDAISSKTSKVKKVDTEAEAENIHSQFKILQQQHEALKVENIKNLEVIDMLEETIKLMEKRDSSPKAQQKSVTVQTEPEDTDIMRCNECEYPAEDIYDLGEHMYEFHALENEGNIACHYCGERFETKGNLMMHRKSAHIDKVNNCTYFSEGNCDFGDRCWYNHSRDRSDSDKTFKCSFCEQIFKTKSDFMSHRKTAHAKKIPICKNSMNGFCQFGRKHCWFNHDETETLNGNRNIEHVNDQNQEMIAKIFDMVEKFTQRIVHLESKI